MRRLYTLYRSYFFLFASLLYTCIVLEYKYFDLNLLLFYLAVLYIGDRTIKFIIQEGIFSICVVFNLFGLLYTSYYIIQLLLYNQPIAANTYMAMNLSFLAIISFNIAYTYTKANINKGYVPHERFNVERFTNYLIIFFVISVLAEYYVIFKSIGLQNYLYIGRSEQALMRSEYSVFTFYNHTIPVVSTTSLFLYLKYKGLKKFFLFVVSFVVTIIGAIITESRADLLSILLPILFILNYYAVISNKQTIIIGVSILILFGIWKSLFSNAIELQYDSEFVSWYRICTNVFSDRISFIWGESYFKTFLNCLIPVTGMEPLSVWYVRTYLPEVYSAGGGRGFSSVLEAYLNFHIFGVVLVYFIYGYLAKKIRPRSILTILVYMIILVSINLLFRSESYSFWKNMMWHKIYPILIFYYLSRNTNRI